MTNNIIPYWEKLVAIDATLNGAPTGILVFLMSVAFGHVWRIAHFLPNRVLPLVIVIFGSLAFVGISWATGNNGALIVRHIMIGGVIGFTAWPVGAFLAVQLDKRFGIKLSEDDTVIITKNETKDKE